MNFCFVVNDKYVTPLFVTLQSIIENNSGFHRFFVITSGLVRENIDRIIRYAQSHDCEAEVIKVDDTCLGNVPILRDDFNRTPYYKLLLPIYLPQNVDKVLYLDVDTVVNKNLEELFTIELGGNYFAAVPDPFINKRDISYVKSLGMTPELGERYFNSGVILFNMCIFREAYKLNDALTYIKNNGAKFRFHDQEVLNGLYFKNYIQLDETYNYLTVFRGLADMIHWLLSGKKKPARQCILHYANSYKPWNSAYLGKYENEYWKYASNSPAYHEIQKNERKSMENQINALIAIAKRKIRRLYR